MLKNAVTPAAGHQVRKIINEFKEVSILIEMMIQTFELQKEKAHLSPLMQLKLRALLRKYTEDKDDEALPSTSASQ